MNKIKEFKIKKCKALNKTNYLLLSKYKISNYGVKEGNYLYNFSSDFINKMDDNFIDIVYCKEDAYVYLVTSSSQDEYIYKSSKSSNEINASNIHCIKNNVLYLLQSDNIILVDESLNILSKKEFDDYSFFDNQVEYYDDNFSFQEYFIKYNEYNEKNILFIDKISSEGYVHDFSNKENIKIFKVGKLNIHKNIKFVCYDKFCYLLTEDKKNFTISKYDQHGEIIEQQKVNGINPFFHILKDKILCIYDDLKKWNKKEKELYPEFEIGASSVIFLG